MQRSSSIIPGLFPIPFKYAWNILISSNFPWVFTVLSLSQICCHLFVLNPCSFKHPQIVCFVSQLTFSAAPLFNTVHYTDLNFCNFILPKALLSVIWILLYFIFSSQNLEARVCLNISQLTYRHFHTVQRMIGSNPALLWSKPNFHQKTWLASKSLLSFSPTMLGQTSPDKRGAEGYRRPPSLSFHWLFFFLSFLQVWVVSCGGSSCVSLHTRKRYTFSHKFSFCYPLHQQPGLLTLGFYIITFAFFEGIECAAVLGNQCLQNMNILNENWIHYILCRCILQ